MCQNSWKTNGGTSIGPGEVDLHLRSVVATVNKSICGAVEGVHSKSGGAGLSVGLVKQLRWASALFKESPSKFNFIILFFNCFL